MGKSKEWTLDEIRMAVSDEDIKRHKEFNMAMPLSPDIVEALIRMASTSTDPAARPDPTFQITRNDPSDTAYYVTEEAPDGSGWEGRGFVEKSGSRSWRAYNAHQSQDGFTSRKAAARWLCLDATPKPSAT